MAGTNGSGSGPADRIGFGRFTLDLRRGSLLDAGGRDIYLRPKAYRTLRHLAERAGTLVGKDALAEAVWPDVAVSDDSLAHCIRDIRKALGPDGAIHLRTVQRRGYMLVREPVPAPQATRRPAPWRVAAGIALLAAAGPLLLADTPPRPDAAPAALPAPQPAAGGDAVAASVRRANDLLAARDWRRREDNETARDLLEAAVAAEPGHAEAWVALGLTYWLEVRHLSWGGGRREMRRALEMVERSIRLGAGPPALALLAEMRLKAPFQEMRGPLDALAAARAAVRLDPDHADSHAILAEVLALTGEPGDSVALIERARRLDPDPPARYGRIAGLAYLLSGDPGRAVEEFRAVHDGHGMIHERTWPGWLLAASLAHSGREEEAAALIAQATRQRPALALPMVAASLDGVIGSGPRALVLEGLRRAGLPG